jgi:hypothetical protein
VSEKKDYKKIEMTAGYAQTHAKNYSLKNADISGMIPEEFNKKGDCDIAAVIPEKIRAVTIVPEHEALWITATARAHPITNESKNVAFFKLSVK